MKRSTMNNPKSIIPKVIDCKKRGRLYSDSTSQGSASPTTKGNIRGFNAISPQPTLQRLESVSRNNSIVQQMSNPLSSLTKSKFGILSLMRLYILRSYIIFEVFVATFNTYVKHPYIRFFFE